MQCTYLVLAHAEDVAVDLLERQAVRCQGQLHLTLWVAGPDRPSECGDAAATAQHAHAHTAAAAGAAAGVDHPGLIAHDAPIAAADVHLPQKLNIFYRNDFRHQNFTLCILACAVYPAVKQHVLAQSGSR